MDAHRPFAVDEINVSALSDFDLEDVFFEGVVFVRFRVDFGDVENRLLERVGDGVEIARHDRLDRTRGDEVCYNDTHQDRADRGDQIDDEFAFDRVEKMHRVLSVRVEIFTIVILFF